MKCYRCHAPVEEQQVYCENCGAKLIPPPEDQPSGGGKGFLLALIGVIALVLAVCVGILGARFLMANYFHHRESAEAAAQTQDAAEEKPRDAASAPAQTGAETAEAAETDYLALYQPVLEAYREHERSGGGLLNWYGDEPGYVHVGLSSVPRLGYMLEDLDGNGVPELILGALYTEKDFEENSWLEPGSYYTNLIVDLYTLADGDPVYLVNSGDRYRYNLTDDGMLYFEGSSGAAYSSVYLYRVEDTRLVYVTGVCIDGGEDRCFQVQDDKDYQHEKDIPISFEDFNERCKELAVYREEHAKPLSLTPLIED